MGFEYFFTSITIKPAERFFAGETMEVFKHERFGGSSGSKGQGSSYS